MQTTMLMVGDFNPRGTCSYRAAAFERLGLTVHRLDMGTYANAGGRIPAALRIRLMVDPYIFLFNRALEKYHGAINPDVTWFDKPTFLHPQTLRRMRRRGGLFIHHNQDNPFSPAPGEPGWRWIIPCIPLFDVNITPRAISLADYAATGSQSTLVMPFAFDPLIHYPSRQSLEPPDLPLTFIGFPYDNRPDLINRLGQSGARVAIFGDHWKPRQRPTSPNVTCSPGVHGADYREHIQRALACLGFVTHSHKDPNAHRSFEVTAAGGMLLAERTDGHQAVFEEGRDCLMFSEVKEAADKAAYLERSPSARQAMAKAGNRRAWRSGYSNDERQAAILAEVDPSRFGHLPEVARKTIARLDPLR
ncbi:glycosyltransferase [Rhodospirillum sp. A1_3_36]|uniref:CgeB family protein n=1 Tax=Rhodospirillum sp. A1_3_36 TaxID=3391666 RepID=UPI0039A63F0C